MKTYSAVLLILSFASLAFFFVTTSPDRYSPAEDSRSRQHIENKIDGLLEPWNDSGTPGAGIAVIENGNVVFEKGYGIANLEYGIPIEPETIFHVASVSKQFTAMAVVLLEEDGALSLEDDIRTFLPELPDYGHTITIRHLLQHTSGIRDQWQTLAIAGWSLMDVITQDQILRTLFRQQELNFPPGTKHNYSNGGYTLVAEIVARVSEMPFPEFCMHRIFRPLGMTNTHFHQDLKRIVPGRAYSYSKADDGFQAAPLNYANVGATSLFTTAGDLVKWLDNFREPVICSPASLARMQEKGILSGGKEISYALGVVVGDFRGVKEIGHSGGDAGYRSHVAWFPEQELGIAVLSNLGNFNTYRVAHQIAELYLEDNIELAKPQPDPVERDFVNVEPDILEQYVGVYPFPEIEQIFKAIMKGGKLMSGGAVQPPLELRPTSSNSFYLERFRADIEFTPLPNNGMRITVTQPGGVTEGVRIENEDELSIDLSEYAGAFWSDELETQYRFFIRDDVLTAVHAHHGEFPLTPIMRDHFNSRKWFTRNVIFKRDEAGDVSAVTLGRGRVKAIEFEKRR